MGKQVRQGDVLLERVYSIPKSAKLVARNRAVLAKGETTGHVHIVAVAGLEMYEDMNGDVYINVPLDTFLRHETVEGTLTVDHLLVPLSKGVHRRPSQVEYSPRAIRQVSD